MNATDFLKKLPAAVKPDAVADLDATVQLNISTPTYVTVRDGACFVAEGTADSPDVTLALSDDDLIELLTGKLDGVMAFMAGKLQVDGDLMLAKDIPGFFDVAKLA